ncbi:MAG TPA: trypsin-like peptidase domain-containing protein [Spirochaetota bacterium]|nr:trypsin-like peptidase domain-containing protein [Spirochaetota bacterium]
MNNKVKYIIPIILAGVAVLTLNTFSCSQNQSSLFGDMNQSPLKGNDANKYAVQMQEAFIQVSDLYRERVVSITTEQTVQMPQHPFYDDPFFRQFFGAPKNRQRERKRTGLGTGFVLSEDGYICTNHHVIAKVDKVTVKVDDETFDAKVVGSDPRTDIALLKIDAGKKLKPVFIGDSDKVQVGDWAIAIGNPFGLDRTFTVGVISATGRRDVDMMGGSQSHIQTDASINPGNSGGPLININGEVIGINRMIYSSSGGYMGIGFAIPMNTAKSILEQLKETGKIKRGFIGVQIVPLTEEYARERGLDDTSGALVGGVMEDSPADKGGIKVGDVILSVKGKEIESFETLLDIVGKAKIGETLKIVVWRNKSRVTLYVTVKERP